MHKRGESEVREWVGGVSLGDKKKLGKTKAQILTLIPETRCNGIGSGVGQGVE